MQENDTYVRRDELQSIVVGILQKVFNLQEKFGPLDLQLDLFGDDASRVADAPTTRVSPSSITVSNENIAGYRYPPAMFNDPKAEYVSSIIDYLRSKWNDELFQTRFARIAEIIQQRNPSFTNEQAVEMMSKFVSTEECRHFAKQYQKWNDLDDRGRADWLGAFINSKSFHFLLNNMKL